MGQRADHETDIFVGLISGTSMDGVDAAVVDFSAPQPAVLAADTLPFDAALNQILARLRADPDRFPAAQLGELDARLGAAFADAALRVIKLANLSAADIRAIGSHGQTVLHRPDDQYPHTIQIGDPHGIARRTGIVTVADFRRADLAAGGQGAPLAPLLHDAILRSPTEDRAVVNLGGIANITRLPKDDPVSGFDTGPANCLLDVWYRHHHEGRFDPKGNWAASGQVDPDWLSRLLDDPYFARTPPKSTGIEYFSAGWLDAHLPDWAGQRPADIQATLAELTARTVADALLHSTDRRPRRVMICGGGVHNDDLVGRLERNLSGIQCQSTAHHGLDPDHVESLLFAWLARLRIHGHRIDSRTITGAKFRVLAGTIAEP